MAAFLIELTGLFCASVALRLAWLRQGRTLPSSAAGRARLGLSAAAAAAWLALVTYSKVVMTWWVAAIVIAGFAAAAWFGIGRRNRASFEPAALFFAAAPIVCAALLWLG